MKIKPRHFPYPVLSSFSDDFKEESQFNVTVEPSFNDNAFNFSVKFTLVNDDLKRLIEQNRATFLLHIECQKNWFRYVEKTTDDLIETSIPSNKLDSRVDLCAFIVANEDLSNYSNETFHPDFEGEIFRISKGDILAIAPEVPIELEKYKFSGSIFLLTQNHTFKEGDMSVNVESDKITISLDQKTHSRYQQLMRVNKLTPIFHSMIAIPALIYAISYIRESIEMQRDMEELTSYPWYKSIKKRLEELDIDIENTSHLEDAVNIAAKILDKPIAEAMKSIEYISQYSEN